jgi:SAM-dependent methyltransferase
MPLRFRQGLQALNKESVTVVRKGALDKDFAQTKMSEKRVSYNSVRMGILGRLREAGSLYSIHLRENPRRVSDVLQGAKENQEEMERTFGFALDGRHILDVGPGQFLLQSTYFAKRNEVTAIDLNVISNGFSPTAYLEMLRHNGLHRVLKTIGRQILGVDRAYKQALRSALGVDVLPHVHVMRGDARALSVEDESFDVVYSGAVMHHVSDPGSALREMARVLKPGGGAFVSLHLYTSYNGSLDPRLMSTPPDEALLWAHLRSGLSDKISGNALVNKVRLHEWKTLFTQIFPGSVIKQYVSNIPAIQNTAERLIMSGELSGYSLEELSTHVVTSVWKKPKDSYR